MSPTQVYEMDDDTWHAFVLYQRDEIKAQKKAAAKRRG